MMKPHHILRGTIALLLISINTVFWFPGIIFFGLFKLLIPYEKWRVLFTYYLAAISEYWTDINNFNIDWFLRFKIEASVPETLNLLDNYLIIANHQSWTDIIVLQKLFNRKIPFFRFFLKRELLYIPLLGLAWWALDYPFMKRYSRETLQKKPHLRGKDLEITRKACEKYKTTPFSIVIFPEGTRFTQKKKEAQQSPYRHLLRPRAGGLSYILYATADISTTLLDLTIIYPQGNPSFWHFLSGRLNQAKVFIKIVPVTESIKGDYASDQAFRKSFQKWINQLWHRKDAKLDNYTV